MLAVSVNGLFLSIRVAAGELLVSCVYSEFCIIETDGTFRRVCWHADGLFSELPLRNQISSGIIIFAPAQVKKIVICTFSLKIIMQPSCSIERHSWTQLKCMTQWLHLSWYKQTLCFCCCCCKIIALGWSFPAGYHRNTLQTHTHLHTTEKL